MMILCLSPHNLLLCTLLPLFLSPLITFLPLSLSLTLYFSIFVPPFLSLSFFLSPFLFLPFFLCLGLSIIISLPVYLSLFHKHDIKFLIPIFLQGIIVRTITRLDELCKDVRNAARVLGNSSLYMYVHLIIL